MTTEQYLVLFEKYLAGKASPEEIEMIMAYKDNLEWDLLEQEKLSEQDKVIQKRIFDKINQTTGQGKIIKMFNYKKVWWSAVAAILIAVLSVFFIRENPEKTFKASTPTPVIKNEVIPGSSKAILTLANGKQIVLNDAANGTIVQQGNIIVKKQKNGMLEFIVSDGPAEENALAGTNTITTPRGGEYQIMLPDGTKVWLNSASSLKFPNAFVEKERNVELSGEGYFEVAKNMEKPFIVKANGTNVQVLGTHFNISAYNDDQFVTTTLLEGSVKLVKENSSAMLFPGQQGSSINGQSAINVKEANLDQVMAWKNGYFLFKNTDIKTIMKQASRWYDIEVDYPDNQQEKQFGGKISRYKDISELLKNLELTGTIHFKLEGRRVTVQ